MSELAPDPNVYAQVLRERWQAAELENVGLTAHIIVQNRTIEEQGSQIASLQQQIDELKEPQDKPQPPDELVVENHSDVGN